MRFGLGIISRMMIFICSGGGMRLTLAFVTIFGLYGSWVDAQRLSQGASDWYMRFYSNMDYVKRNVDGPVTKSFVVTADILYRYATTMVTTVVHNPANVAQNYTFGFVMPKEAFVSNVSIVRQPSGAGVDDPMMNAGVEHVKSTQGRVTMSSELFSQIANQEDDKDKNEETSQSQDWIQLGLPFHQFVLPVSLGANDEARITLTYEQMLSKKEDNYNYVVSLSPGERVDDFQVGLSIVDERTLGHVKITAPVIGTIADQEVVATKEYQHRFNMSLVDQALNFGRHGFTGDLVMQFSLEEDNVNELDIVVEDDTFVHFYHGPPGEMESNPVHVLFLFDTSMSQDKLTMGKEAFSTLMSSLTDKDLFNLALFNGVYGKRIEHWKMEDESTFIGTDENVEKVLAFVDNISEVENWNSSSTNYIFDAIDENVALFRDLSSSGRLPANTFSRIVLVTDGRLESLDNTESRRRRLLRNPETKSLPLTIIGIGSDANMAHLEGIANGDDDLIENVIEDAPVEHQLDAVVKHLHDVILKDLEFRYLDQEGEVIPVTHHQYKFLKRGSDIVVSGQMANADMLQNLKAVEIQGQMAEGQYSKRVPFLASPRHLGCNGNITLCSLPAFQGKCLTFNSSVSRLVKFHKKAVSALISGTCSWLVFTKRNFRGGSKKAQLLPGAHEVLPGNLYQSIASLQVAHPLPDQLEMTEADKTSWNNPLHHHYSYLKIKHIEEALKDSDENELNDLNNQAYEAAMHQHFLTPYTHLEFHGNADDNEIVTQSIVTFQDLSPIFFQVNDPELEQLEATLRQCEKPVECQDNFHFEVYEGDIINNSDDKCNGSLTLYTRPSGEGENLEIRQSLSQIYHANNGGRMHSYTSVGNCCWLIFNHGFFKGKVNKICGDTIQNLWKDNIGSVKKIAFQPAVRK